MSTPEELINSLAEQGIENIKDRIWRLESNDYYRPIGATGITSNPPTQGELDGILGTPESYKTNTIALVRDTTNGRNWLCFGELDTNDWYFVEVMGSSPIIGARVEDSTNQSTTSSVVYIVSFDTEEYDVGSFHDNSTNNSRLTIPVSGFYSLKFGLKFAVNSTGIRRARFLLNGTTDIGENLVQATVAAPTVLVGAIDYYLEAGDYVEVEVFQDSGVPLNILAQTGLSPLFMINKI